MSMRAGWIISTVLASSVAVADFKPDFSAVMKDLEMMSRSEDRMTFVLWLPIDFWRFQLQAQAMLTPKAIDQIITSLDPYTIIAVVDAQPEVGGAFTYTEEEKLEKMVSLEDRAGNGIQPLELDSVSNNVKNLVQMMHPVLANAMGSMGSHFELFVFPARDKDGKPIADATKEGSLTVHVGDRAFRYRLPLGSLLPPAVDTKTGESFPGNYHFNPFTGNKLTPSAGR
ncbi:MAG TPA: hypothetical protein VME21_15920 [Steroidobacteraceae bacterium]|nr:hypothetical protein [Steroidobacteraceae bacterium]